MAPAATFVVDRRQTVPREPVSVVARGIARSDGAAAMVVVGYVLAPGARTASPTAGVTTTARPASLGAIPVASISVRIPSIAAAVTTSAPHRSSALAEFVKVSESVTELVVSHIPHERFLS